MVGLGVKSKALRRAVESHIEARLVAMQREVRLEVGAGQGRMESFFGLSSCSL